MSNNTDMFRVFWMTLLMSTAGCGPQELDGAESANGEELATTENHPSWTHMYQMMMLAQIGFALAYVF